MFKLALHWRILAGMLLGAALGLTLNFSASQSEVVLSGRDLPDGVRSVRLRDSTTRVEIVIERGDGQQQRIMMDATRTVRGSFSSLEKLAEREPQAWNWFREHGRSIARRVGDGAQRLGSLFLRLLQMVSIPLIVCSLLTGVMGLGHPERLGPMFGRTVVYYLATSLLAIVTGLVLVNLIRPGLTAQVSTASEAKVTTSEGMGVVLFQQLENLIPSNPFASLAQANFLSIISFSVTFAIFAVLVGGVAAERIRDLAEACFEIIMRMTMAIIQLAPLGVGCMMLSATATQGLDLFQSLGWYMLTVLAALMIHGAITLPLIVWLWGRKNPWRFAQALSPALLTAFSSASSNATLPLTLTCVEQRAGISNRVSSFVLPLGATINMDGTALYEAVAVLFIAQLYHGATLPLLDQVLVAFTALLASVGAAGIPHAGLVMMVIILQTVGLPVELQGIILAVDRVLDMSRTCINVWSDACGCAVVSRYETRNA